MVVEDLEIVVTDKVRMIHRKSISIEHTYGAGMFIPGELPSGCQIRGGYIQGAMSSFDFRFFMYEVSHNSVSVESRGTLYDVEE